MAATASLGIIFCAANARVNAASTSNIACTVCDSEKIWHKLGVENMPEVSCDCVIRIYLVLASNRKEHSFILTTQHNIPI